MPRAHGKIFRRRIKLIFLREKKKNFWYARAASFVMKHHGFNARCCLFLGKIIVEKGVEGKCILIKQFI